MEEKKALAKYRMERFVKTGIIKIDVSRVLTKSFEMRQDIDYEDFITVTKEEVEKVKNDVRAFIEECKIHLATI